MQEYIDFTKELARASGEIIQRYFLSNLTVDHKDDASPVTVADRQAEQIMRTMIQERYPDHGIIGEEFDDHQPDAEYKWVLDPIDGTKSFIHGTFLFGTLIALMQGDTPIIGAIHHPAAGQLLIGNNDAAWLNDTPVQVRACDSIADASVLCTYWVEVGEYQDRSGFDALIQEAKLFRTWGDCHGYFLVGTGHADVMIDPAMHFWDIVALIPIIRGAGGRITDWAGGDPLSGNGLLATGGTLHDEIVQRLNGN